MRLSLLAAAALAAACLLGEPSSAQAQIRIGIGGGGGSYPMGGFGYGPSLGGWNSQYMVPGYPYYGNGRPSNSSYYRNNNNAARRIVAVQPKRQGDGLPIMIQNPADSGTPLNYALDGGEHLLKPGESQLLVNDRLRTITFDRGESFGTAEYAVSPGLYWFELTSDHGWELYHDDDVSKLTKQNQATKANQIPSQAK